MPWGTKRPDLAERNRQRIQPKLPEGWKSYMQQRRNAHRRGIAFHLSFEEWWDIWQASGHWHERGKRVGQYGMARLGDRGSYIVGNVAIVTTGDNLRDQNRDGRQHSEATKAKISAAMRKR